MRGFRPGTGITVLTLGAVAAFCCLGTWQAVKHVRRSALLAEQESRLDLAAIALAEAVQAPDATSFRRVSVRGRLELADTVIVTPISGPEQTGHALGARVFTPLQLEGASEDAARVLVARGWVPYEELKGFLPPESAAPGDVIEVSGVILPLATKEAKPGARDKRSTRLKNLSPDRPAQVAKLAEQLPYALEPVMIQSSTSEGVLVAETVKPVSPIDHRGYAFTWFSVAVLCVSAWIEYGRRAAREHAAV